MWLLLQVLNSDTARRQVPQDAAALVGVFLLSILHWECLFSEIDIPPHIERVGIDLSIDQLAVGAPLVAQVVHTP